MKKAILKIFGVVALAAGMLYNVQMSDSESSSNISLAALANVAVANSENSSKYDVYCKDWGYTCTPTGKKPCNDDDC